MRQCATFSGYGSAARCIDGVTTVLVPLHIIATTSATTIVILIAMATRFSASARPLLLLLPPPLPTPPRPLILPPLPHSHDYHCSCNIYDPPTGLGCSSPRRWTTCGGDGSAARDIDGIATVVVPVNLSFLRHYATRLSASARLFCLLLLLPALPLLPPLPPPLLLLLLCCSGGRSSSTGGPWMTDPTGSRTLCDGSSQWCGPTPSPTATG